VLPNARTTTGIGGPTEQQPGACGPLPECKAGLEQTDRADRDAVPDYARATVYPVPCAGSPRPHGTGTLRLYGMLSLPRSPSLALPAQSLTCSARRVFTPHVPLGYASPLHPATRPNSRSRDLQTEEDDEFARAGGSSAAARRRDVIEYRHKFFHRDQPELLTKVIRKTNHRVIQQLRQVREASKAVKEAAVASGIPLSAIAGASPLSLLLRCCCAAGALWVRCRCCVAACG